MFLVEGDAEFFEVGDVGFVELGDVRDDHPVAVQIGAGKLLDARQRFVSTAPNLAKSTFGHPATNRARRRAAGRAPRNNTPLTKACTSSLRMRPLGRYP